MLCINDIKNRIESEPARSAWKRGVKAYALELLEDLQESVNGGYFDLDDIIAPRLLHAALLNGATSWKEYSRDGYSLIYNEDISRRLCTPSEPAKTRNGERRPNSHEEWLDVQARALHQAEKLIQRAARETTRAKGE